MRFSKQKCLKMRMNTARVDSTGEFVTLRCAV
jgi:hypothetical protein